MPLIQIPQSVRPCQIEFGPEVERSKPGALYFTPSSTKKITKAEWEWIQKNHPQLAAALVVLPFDENKGRLAKQKAAGKPGAQPKRPKDNVSKAKQKAEALLKKAAAGKSVGKQPVNKAVAPAPEPMPVAEPEPETSDEGGKKKKKWG